MAMYHFSAGVPRQVTERDANHPQDVKIEVLFNCAYAAAFRKYPLATWCRQCGGCALRAPLFLVPWGVDAVALPRREVLVRHVLLARS